MTVEIQATLPFRLYVAGGSVSDPSKASCRQPISPKLCKGRQKSGAKATMRKIGSGKTFDSFKRTWLAALVAATTSIALPAMADDLVQEKATSEISVSKDASGYHIHTVTRNYLYNAFVAATVEATTDAPYLRQLLLVEKTTALTDADHEDPASEPGRIKVTAFPLTDKGKGGAQFTIAAEGDEVIPDGSYLTITRLGCCVENATKAVYSLENGKYLFNTTGEQWTTLGAKGGFAMTRIAVAHVQPSAADDVILGKEPNAGALLSYASPTAPLQRIMVMLPADAASDATLNWAGDLLWVSAEYPDGTNHIYVDRVDKPENVFTAVTLRFKLDDTNVIDIPLRQDRLDVASAKLPHGFTLKEVAVP